MMPPLRVRVRPYADLARYFPGTGHVREVDVPAGATIQDLLERYGVTSFCAPPTAFRMMVLEDLKQYDLRINSKIFKARLYHLLACFLASTRWFSDSPS